MNGACDRHNMYQSNSYFMFDGGCDLAGKMRQKQAVALSKTNDISAIIMCNAHSHRYSKGDSK